MIFIDTSALYSLLDRSDTNHATASAQWRRLLAEDAVLVTSNYVLIETAALVQGRLGMAAVRDFHEGLAPLLKIHWIDSSIHTQGVGAVLAANRRQLSLVDCISFAICRQMKINRVFAFDQHFVEQGFLPPYDSLEQ